MLSVAEAQSIVLQHAKPLPGETVALTPAALGLVLAEDVVSDIDMPPYDKALMDGYAVRSCDLPEGRGVLTVVEEITAGHIPQVTLGPNQAARIMTGAPIPTGADAVVVVERTQMVDADRVAIDDKSPKPGQSIMSRGREMRDNDTVLAAGAVLRAPEFGVLATVGRVEAKVHPAPRVSILCTGNEVIEPTHMPGLGQIRNGNGYMLTALVASAGGVPYYLGIARDEITSLRSHILEGLQANVLVLSGGVSAGKFDLVPDELQHVGVQAHFHKVEMKPGKPIFFGTQGDTLVFGLPGNPVSSLACFELFVRPALRRLRGHANPGPHWRPAALREDFTYRTDRPTYHPAHMEENDRGWSVQPVPWFGSPDLRALTRANALVLFPVGEAQYRAGQVFPALRLANDCRN